MTMAWFFFLGAATMFVPWHWRSLLLLTVGLISVLILDVIAARRGEVPRYFQMLRPVQMTVGIADVMVLLVRSTMLS